MMDEIVTPPVPATGKSLISQSNPSSYKLPQIERTHEEENPTPAENKEKSLQKVEGKKVAIEAESSRSIKQLVFQQMVNSGNQYLKLVTVAQKRELTPEIVKAALFTPASAKIPAPQINLAAIPGPRPENKVGAALPPVSAAAVPSVSGAAPTAIPSFGIGGQQGLPVQQSQYMRPPQPPIPSIGFQSQPGVLGQGMPGEGTVAAFGPPSSSDWRAGNGGYQAPATSQAPNMGIISRSQDGFDHAFPQQNQQKTTFSALPRSATLNDATPHLTSQMLRILKLLQSQEMELHLSRLLEMFFQLHQFNQNKTPRQVYLLLATYQSH